MTQPRLPYYKASDALREKVVASLRAERRRPFVVRPWAPLAAAAALVLLAAGWLVGRNGRNAEAELADVVSAHLRSLAPGRLTDVASTDQHTVKPWFAGKLAFSPLVSDQVSQGFPLVGGRVDFVAGQPAAALVYTRRQHVINVFELPAEAPLLPLPRTLERRGYHAIRWSSGGLMFWAVSDLNVSELEQLAGFLRLAGNPPRN